MFAPRSETDAGQGHSQWQHDDPAVPHNDHESNPIAIDVLKKKGTMLEAIKANPNIKTDTLLTNFLKSTGKDQASSGQNKSLHLAQMDERRQSY